MSENIRKITLIGSGNIATQLGKKLLKSGVEIVQVWSRNLQNANLLAESLSCRGINRLDQLKSTDLFIVAISDDGIKKMISDLPSDTPAVHTSGNTPLIERLKDGVSGVLYPLQTFQKNSTPEWNEIPICIESSDDGFLKSLFRLGEKLSPKVKIISSTERAKIHTAAVFACNFTNHLSALAEGFLKENNLSFDLLKPLLHRTFENINDGDIKSKQTGPAVREDYGTMDDHMKLLSENEEMKSLYLTLSKHIIHFHNDE